MRSKTILIQFLLSMILTSADDEIFDRNIAYGPISFTSWFETGFISITSAHFSKYSSLINTFRNPHIFIGLPIDGDDKIDSGYQACFRLNDITNTTLNPGPLSFSVKMTQPNDTWCNYSWWTPKIEEQGKVPYLIFEQGHYNLSGVEFDISDSLFDSHCAFDSHRHLWLKSFDIHAAKPAIIAQVQTYHDPRFLTFREISSALVNTFRGITLFIQLHNVDKSKWHPKPGDCVLGHLRDHYDNNFWRQAYTLSSERISILGFTPTYAASCDFGYAFETYLLRDMTSDAKWINFHWNYYLNPGIFGMINSYRGSDSSSLRIFQTNTTGTKIIIQEDRCDKVSMVHRSAESAGLFVTGVLEEGYIMNKDGLGEKLGQTLKLKRKKIHLDFDTRVSEVSFDCIETLTIRPSLDPTATPSIPTDYPTSKPTSPTDAPTSKPTEPTSEPTFVPSRTPHSGKGFAEKQDRFVPSFPSNDPTTGPSIPSVQPSSSPSVPSTSPTVTPSVPSVDPTTIPSRHPHTGKGLHGVDSDTKEDITDKGPHDPTSYPSLPTYHPTSTPSEPSISPTSTPSEPTVNPTPSPSKIPHLGKAGRDSLNLPTGIPLVVSNITNITVNSSLSMSIPQLPNTSSKRDDGYHNEIDSIYHEAMLDSMYNQVDGDNSFSNEIGEEKSSTAGFTDSLSLEPTSSPSLQLGLRPLLNNDHHNNVTHQNNTKMNHTHWPTGQPTSSPTVQPVCIKFTLEDKFDDGWGKAHFFLTDSYGYYQKLAPGCGIGYVQSEYCFNPKTSVNGDTVSASVFGYHAEFPWEILWSAYIPSTNELHYGTYDTNMIFTFKNKMNSDGISKTFVVLSSAENMYLEDTIVCESCRQGDTVAEVTDSSRKKKCNTGISDGTIDHNYGNGGYRNEYHGSYHSSTDSSGSKGTSVTRPLYEGTDLNSTSDYSGRSGDSNTSIASPDAQNASTSIVSSIPSQVTSSTMNKEIGDIDVESALIASYTYAEIDQLIISEEDIKTTNTNTDIINKNNRKLINNENVNGYKLFDSNDRVWFSNDRRGTEFYISDINGVSWYYSGTLCAGNPSRGTCNLQSLPSGSYIWRTTGSLDENRGGVAFSFCSIAGSASTEIKFKLDCNGNCIPLRMRGISAICSSQPNYETLTDEDTDDENQASWLLDSKVNLEGKLVINGVSREDLSPTDKNVIQTALLREIQEISGPDHAITMKEFDLEGVHSSSDLVNHRRGLLQNFGIDESISVSFTMVCTAKKLGAYGYGRDHLDHLQNDLMTYLHKTTKSGVFASRLKTIATEKGSVAFVHVLTTGLQSFSIRHENPTIMRVTDLLESGLWMWMLTGLTLFAVLVLVMVYVRPTYNKFIIEKLYPTNIDTIDASVGRTLINPPTVSLRQQMQQQQYHNREQSLPKTAIHSVMLSNDRYKQLFEE